MPMIRLAVIDAGGQAEEYAFAVPRVHNMSITAIVDADDGVAELLCSRVDAEIVVDSLEQLVAVHGQSIDAVAVHSPLSRRCQMVCQAAAAGKHVLVDAPMAGSLAEAERAIDACRSSGVQLMVGSPLRFMPYQRTVRESLDAGKLGAPGLLRLHHWHPASETLAGSGTPQGLSLDLIIGEVDIACWLFNAAPEVIYAHAFRDDLLDCGMQLHLGFPAGGMALIDCARVLPTGSGPYYSLTLIGSTGAAYADDQHNTNLLFRDGTQGLRVDQGHGYFGLQLQEFVDAVHQARTPNSSGEQGKRAIEVAQAAIDSCVAGRVANWLGDRYEVQHLGQRNRDDSHKAAAAPPAPDLPVTHRENSCPPSAKIRVAVLSVVKHDYVAKGILSHARFEPVVVADDPDQPDWVHARNQQFADEFAIPYVRNIERAIFDYKPDVAVVSPAAERHCNLSVRAARAGLHVVQDKPMSTKLSECDRVIQAVDQNQVRFMMWNRNFLPAILQAQQVIESGQIGTLRAIHVDFYFAKDAGPPIGSRQQDAPPLDWLEFLKAAHATGADGGVGADPMGELEVEGIYPLAYIHMLTGARVQRAFARTQSHFHQLHADNVVDDLATVTLHMEGGLLGTLCIGRIGNASHPDIGEIKLHLIGSDGALVVSEARPEVGVYYRDQPNREFPHVRVANHNDWLLADNFARSIDTGTDTILGPCAGRAICATVHAAIASGRTGEVVEVVHRG